MQGLNFIAFCSLKLRALLPASATESQLLTEMQKYFQSITAEQAFAQHTTQLQLSAAAALEEAMQREHSRLIQRGPSSLTTLNCNEFSYISLIPP